MAISVPFKKCSNIDGDLATGGELSTPMALHKELKPDNYQQKCTVCSSTIKESIALTEYFQEHLLKYTDFLNCVYKSMHSCLATDTIYL